MANWLMQTNRRVSDGSSSSSLEPTFRINNPRNRGRRVTSGGSVLRAERRTTNIGDLSLSTEEIGFEYPVLDDWNSAKGNQGARDECVIFVDPADRRLTEPVPEFAKEYTYESSLRTDLRTDANFVAAINLETVNSIKDEDWIVR